MTAVAYWLKFEVFRIELPVIFTPIFACGTTVGHSGLSLYSTTNHNDVSVSMQISVKVKPNSKKPGLEEQADGTWIARVGAPPVDGKANEALIKLVADHFDVSKSRVSIVSGAGSRQKRINVDV